MTSSTRQRNSKNEAVLDSSTKSLKPLNLRNNYDIGEIIGTGAFSEVRHMVCKLTKEKYAVKIIDKRKCQGKEHMIRSEIAILERAEHPNIIRLHGMYESQRKIYLIMELVQGGELFDRIVNRGRYDEEQASYIVHDILIALEYLHKNGICHRDLKPENILFNDKSDNAVIKLGDFGLSKIFSDEIVMKTACGTPGYVAPEVLSRCGYKIEVDMWSLGVITYILLCGYPPFHENNNTLLFEKIMKGEFEYNESFWDDISHDAKDFVSSLLIVDPRKRMSTKTALAHPFIKAYNHENSPRFTVGLGSGRLAAMGTPLKKTLSKAFEHDADRDTEKNPENEVCKSSDVALRPKKSGFQVVSENDSRRPPPAQSPNSKKDEQSERDDEKYVDSLSDSDCQSKSKDADLLVPLTNLAKQASSNTVDSKNLTMRPGSLTGRQNSSSSVDSKELTIRQSSKAQRKDSQKSADFKNGSLKAAEIENTKEKDEIQEAAVSLLDDSANDDPNIPEFAIYTESLGSVAQKTAYFSGLVDQRNAASVDFKSKTTAQQQQGGQSRKQQQQQQQQQQQHQINHQNNNVQDTAEQAPVARTRRKNTLSTRPKEKSGNFARLLSYDIGMRAFSLKTGLAEHKDSRLNFFCDRVLSQYDIVCLQQLSSSYNTRVSRLFEKAADLGFISRLSGTSVCRTSLTSSSKDPGLVILSRFPIADSTWMPFTATVPTNDPRDVVGGVLYAKVLLSRTDDGERYLHLFNIHRPHLHRKDAQIVALKRFIAAAVRDAPPTDAVILAGNFGVDGRVSQGSNYQEFMRILSKQGAMTYLDGEPSEKCRECCHDDTTTASGRKKDGLRSSVPPRLALGIKTTPPEMLQFSKTTVATRCLCCRCECCNRSARVFDWVDVIHRLYNEHPVTYGDILRDGVGRQPAETTITPTKDQMKCMSLDRVLWHKGVQDWENEGLVVDYSDCKVEKFAVSGKPYSHLSDHYGVTMTFKCVERPTETSNIKF